MDSKQRARGADKINQEIRKNNTLRLYYTT
jgi:hypothetical protein